MGVTIHAKSDSEVTSIDAFSPPRSPRRPLYYVQSPSHSHHDLEKMSYGSSPFGSPAHHYHCSPIHHSRESSTSRFSASLKNPARNQLTAWKRIPRTNDDDPADEDVNDDELGEDDGKSDDEGNVRFYMLCFLFSFVVLFTIFSLILWAASVPYKPKIFVKVRENAVNFFFTHFRYSFSGHAITLDRINTAPFNSLKLQGLETLRGTIIVRNLRKMNIF